MRISDWSSDVCSSDLVVDGGSGKALLVEEASGGIDQPASTKCPILGSGGGFGKFAPMATCVDFTRRYLLFLHRTRSEEHTSELQSLMRISYAVFCLKKKKHYVKQERYIHHLTCNIRIHMMIIVF